MILSKPRILRAGAHGFKKGRVGFSTIDVIEVKCDVCGKVYKINYHSQQLNFKKRADRDLCRGCRQHEDYQNGVRTYTWAEYNKKQLGKSLTERLGSDDWKINHHYFAKGINNPHKFADDSPISGRGYAGWYSGYLFRSLFELSFIYKMLNENHIIKSAETITIYYKDASGTVHQYRPDFLVDNKYLYEIKDFRELDSEVVLLKKRAAESYCSNNNLEYILFSNKDFKQLTRAFIVELYRTGQIIFTNESLLRFKKYYLKEGD